MTRTAFAFRRITAASILLLGVSLGACSDDDDDDDGGGSTAATDYVGLVSSTDGQTGPLDITFESAVSAPPVLQEPGAGPSRSSGAPVNATGTVALGGNAPVAITGTLDGGALNMTGTGWTLAGTLSNGKLTGTFTAPGPANGTLVAAGSTAGTPAIALCGSYAGQDFTTNPPEDDFGTFSLVIAGTSVLGTVVSDGGSVLSFTGTATASTVTITATQGSLTLTASGEYDEFGVGGSYAIKYGSTTVNAGSFSGGTCDSPT